MVVGLTQATFFEGLHHGIVCLEDGRPDPKGGRKLPRNHSSSVTLEDSDRDPESPPCGRDSIPQHASRVPNGQRHWERLF